MRHNSSALQLWRKQKQASFEIYFSYLLYLLTLWNAFWIDTIKLQIGYDSAYVKQEVARQQNITNLSHESNRLIDEIVSFEPRSGNDFEGITLLYKKIFNYLLYKNKQHIIGKYSNI